MDKLVVDHSYALGIAWDRTEHRNHGVLYQSPPGTGYFQSSLSFAPGRSSPGSMVVIPPSPSLKDLGAIKVRCYAFTNAMGGGARRQNLVEGQGSFAFFINADLSLQGTFLDPTNNWVGIRSAVRAVIPNQWFQLEYFYDGISWAEIHVNGALVASSYNAGSLIGPPMMGGVRGTGPRGIAIGHWPEPDDRYTMAGYIRDVQIWKRDPLEPLKTIDRCCVRDLSYFYDLGQKLKAKGYNLAYANQLRERLLAEGAQAVAGLRGGTDQGTQEFNSLMQQFLYALSRSGSVPLAPSLEPLLLWAAQRVDKQQTDDLLKRMQALLAELPIKQEQFEEITKKLCFSKLRTAVDQIAKTSEEDPRWKRVREKYKR